MNNDIIENAILNNCEIHENCTIENNWSYISQEPVANIITSTNIYTIAKEIVIYGLNQININELAEIFCNKLIDNLDKNNKYKTLLQLSNNNHLYVLKCILENNYVKNEF